MEPSDARRKVDPAQRPFCDSPRKIAFMAPTAVPDLIEAALVGLRLADLFAALDPVKKLAIDHRAITHSPVEQRELVIALAYGRAHVRH